LTHWVSQTSSVCSSSWCRSEEASPALQLTRKLASRVLLACNLSFHPHQYLRTDRLCVLDTEGNIGSDSCHSCVANHHAAQTFYSYWRAWLTNVIESIVCFRLTVLISVEIGIASGVSFSVLRVQLRTMLTHLTPVTGSNNSTLGPGPLSSLDLRTCT
jgi:hypothetical protein